VRLRGDAGAIGHDVFLGAWVIGMPPGPPTSPAVRPSRITSTRSQTPMISGSSLEMTTIPISRVARSSMIR